MNDRGRKLLLVYVNIVVAYMVFLEAYLPYRVRTDEYNKLLDISHLLEANAVSDVAYFAGQYNAFQTALLLRITDVPMGTQLQTLSSFVGGIQVSIIALSCYLLIDQSTDSPVWWGFLPGIVSIVVFAGLLNRAIEVSHKGYIFALFFLALYLVGRLYLGNVDWRFSLAVIVVGFTIAMFSYIWGAIFTLFLIGALLLGDYNVRRRGFQIVSILSIVVLTLPFENPLSGVAVGLISSKVSSLLTTGSSGVSVNTTARVAQWPVIEFFGISINSWFIVWSGVFIIGIISGLATLSAGIQYVRGQRTLRPLGLMVIGYNSIAFLMIVVLAVSRNFSIARRFIPYIGIFTLLYWVAVYSDRHSYWEAPTFFANQRKTVLRITLAVLMLTAVLGVPRSLSNGDGPPFESPIDHYIEANEVARFGFYDHNSLDDETYLLVPRSEVMFKRVGWQLVDRDINMVPQQTGDHQIYDSGTKGSILYRPRGITSSERTWEYNVTS